MPVALKSNALVDLASMKSFLSIPSGETGADDTISDFINSASEMIERYCDRKFQSESLVEIRDGSGVSEILLYQYPIVSITSLKIDSNRVWGSDTVVDSTSYGFMMDKSEKIGIHLYDSVFPRGRNIVKIEYTFGYSSYLLVPSDLAMACKFTAGYYYNRQQQKDYTMQTKSKGEENITLIEGIPAFAAKILDCYKRLEIPEQAYPIRNQN